MIQQKLDGFSINMTRSQQIIYGNVCCNPGSSCADISRITGLPINRITPRVLELRRSGLIEFSGYEKDGDSNKRVKTWKMI